MIAVAAIAGVLAAAGVMVIARELWPAPPRLKAALAHIQVTQLEPSQRTGSKASDRLGGWLASRFARQVGLLAIPRTDLALRGQTVERFMVEKLALFVAGIVIPSVLFSLLMLMGISPPWTAPVLISVGLALTLSFVPDVSVRSQARAHRKEFRFAFCCYLQLVVLERGAGAAVNAALEGPARVADAWPFRRIDTALQRARRAQQQPWRALAELGDEIGVHDLVDLAYTAEIAGGEGAKMHDVLAAKIAAMRHEASASARSEANARTTTMWVPTSLLMLGFVILVGYPFFSQLIESG